MGDDAEEDRRSVPGQPGIAVDSAGGQVVDPTKNVEDLVEAKGKSDDALRKENQRFFDAQLQSADKYHNFARDAAERYQNFAREAGDKYNSAIVNAETRRIDQLAQTRQEFQNTIRDMLAESVRTTSTLVSTQLVQIQATFDTRVSKLEAQAFTAAGRSSVNDPAIESAMSRMSAGIAALSTQTAESMNKMAGINAEAMAKIAATVSAMQSSAASTAGEHVGTGEATSAQSRTAAFELLKSQAGHSNTQIMVSMAVGVVAALGLVLSIFVAMRQPQAPVYQAPVYQQAPQPPSPQKYPSRGTGYRATFL
jgi:acid phosphatase family membrane protein YuiD